MDSRIPRQGLVREFFSLVRIDSEGIDCSQMRDHLVRTFRDRFRLRPMVLRTSESANLLVRVPGIPHLPPLLLCAHMDTVAPGKGIRPRLKSDRIVSDGRTVLGADDKAAIAVFLQFLELRKRYRLRTRPLELLFTYGEESGLLGARRLDPSVLESREALCFDAAGPFGRISVAAPWYARYDIVVHGKASHAGIAPESGINAVKAAGFLITQLPSGRLDAKTTANIGTIRGGRQNNIVPDEAVITGEVRSLDPERLEFFLTRIRQRVEVTERRFGARIDLKIVQEFQGFRFGRSDPLLKRVTAAMRRIGIRPVLERHNGGSDANILNGLGIRTLNLSVGMEHVHSTYEFIRVKDLVLSLEFLLAFLDASTEVGSHA